MARLRTALPGLETGDFPPFTPEGDRRHAAVSLVLRRRGGLEALLIRRARAEGDPWSGHMALPGGRRDRSDADLLATARRETLEETGVDLEGMGVSLGILDPLRPSTFRLPPLSIYPFVFAVPPGAIAKPSSHEVDEVLWTPLSVLFAPTARGTVRIPLGEISKDFPCLRVGGRVIWGLTYRILEDFLRRLDAGEPELLAPSGSISP